MKRILPLLVVLFMLSFSTDVFAQPTNDDCGNVAGTAATPIPFVPGPCSVTGTITGSTSGATHSTAIANPSTWIDTITRDVWFEFTTPVNGGNPWDGNISVTSNTVATLPRFALYRGNCSFPVMIGLGSVSNEYLAPTPASIESTVDTCFLGLDPATTYYIRIGHWGFQDTMDFTINVEKCQSGETPLPTDPPVVNNDCCGTLYDSGGPLGDYNSSGLGEDYYYTICPTTPHSCVNLDFVNFAFGGCGEADRIEIYPGQVQPPFNQADVVTMLRDAGSANVNVYDSCVTIRIFTDQFVNDAGFEMNWSCRDSCPPPPPISDCDSATIVTLSPDVPFSMTGLTTCGAGNSYTSTDACQSSFLEGEEVVFAYTSPGNECIAVNVTNTSSNTGVFLLNSCPNSDAAICLDTAVSTGGNSASINSIELENPGTYYIVVSSEIACAICTGFDIEIKNVPCPIDVNPNVTDSMMVNTIAANGVLVENFTLNCPQGAYGTFTGGFNLDGQTLEDGIILCTGTAEDAEGPNDNELKSTSLGLAGDPQLTAYAGNTTHDACILEFDVFVLSDVLTFNYVFGSEDYHSLAGELNSTTFPPSPFPNLSVPPVGFVDAFAINIRPRDQPVSSDVNLAVLPNTATRINPGSVNLTTNGAFYNKNPLGTLALQYDGFTDIMQANATVVPCNWYHITLKIADAGDLLSDSGLFIEANSLSSNLATISGSGVNFNNQINAAEECANGQFNIGLLIPQNDTAVIHLDVQGTALNGIDYGIDSMGTPIPDSIIFAPGQTNFSLPLIPISDNIAEGPETVIIRLFAGCDTINPFDSVVIIVRDELSAAMPDSIQLCGGPVELPLVASGADFVTWSPAAGLDDSTAVNPMAFPQVPTDYTVTVSNGICDTTLMIHVDPVTLTTTGSDTFCLGGSSQFTSTTNANNPTYSWAPADGLSCTDCPNPVASPTAPGVYNYTLTFTTPQCVVTETKTVVVLAIPNPDLPTIPTICEGTTVEIGDANASTDGVTYTWTADNANGTISDLNSNNPSATPSETTTYTVVSDNGYCSTTETITVNVVGGFTLTMDPTMDTTVNLGSSVLLNTTVTASGTNPIGTITYAWDPPAGLSSTSVEDPTATPQVSTTYSVTVTNEGGCTESMDVFIEVIPPTYAFPNAFTPNGDDQNDYFKLLQNGNIEILEMKVFNRWGQVVYDNVNPQGWDGTYNGKPMPQDTYAYFARFRLFDGTEIQLNGDVLLIR